MKLLQYLHDGVKSLGVLRGDDVINLSECNADVPSSMVDFLAGGSRLRDIARDALDNAKRTVCVSDVKLLPPVSGCEKVIGVGLNYADHCAEQRVPLPEVPLIFAKFPSCVVGDGDEVILPTICDSVDFECELAAVIGKRGRHICKEDALDFVAGYTVANDVGDRGWMRRNAEQCLLGNSFDTFCPLGPVLVTSDSIPDPGNLDIRCAVNGVVMQDSNTSQMVFGVAECVAWVSQFFTLQPGDVLLTGTPAGVGGCRCPPVYLKHGDVVTCSIAEIGTLRNPVVQEQVFKS